MPGKFTLAMEEKSKQLNLRLNPENNQNAPPAFFPSRPN
jgi:hypothetical protein